MTTTDQKSTRGNRLFMLEPAGVFEQRRFVSALTELLDDAVPPSPTQPIWMNGPGRFPTASRRVVLNGPGAFPVRGVSAPTQLPYVA